MYSTKYGSTYKLIENSTLVTEMHETPQYTK